MVMEAGAAQEVFDEISVKGTECKVPVDSARQIITDNNG
jgi:hypothetical protein